MLIMPNQESEWVQQVVRNIPSPALSIQWDNSDFEAKKGSDLPNFLDRLKIYFADLVEGFANNIKDPKQEH